jgi:hypothetical protein
MHSNVISAVTPALVDMIAYWPFEEGSGSVTYDITDNFHDGTLCNGASFSTDYYLGNFSIYFDGSDDYIDVGVIDLGNEFTICMWTKITSTHSMIRTFIANSVSGAGKDGIRIGVNSYGTADQKIIAYIGNGTTYNDGSTNSGIYEFNQWNHVAVVVKRTEGRIRLYYNGDDVTNDSIIGNDFNVTNTINLGRMLDDKWFLNGYLDDVRIYNRTLSGSEIMVLANPFKTASGKSQTQTVIYPNPFNDELFLDNVADVSKIELINLMGESVKITMNNKLAHIAMDVRDLAKGYYILRCTKTDGNILIVQLTKL